MSNNQKGLILGLFTYKICVNTLRLIIGFTLLYAKGSLEMSSRFLFHKPLFLPVQPLWFIYSVAWILIIFSVIEIFLAVLMKNDRNIGARGLFIMAILWIPIEFILITRFLAAHKITSLLIDFLIIYLLLRIIRGSKKKRR